MAAIDRFIVDHEIPVVRFVKGDVKEDIAREYFKRAEREGRYGVVLIGVAQEKTTAWRGWREGGPDGHPHFEYRRQSVFVNHYYFYIRDPEWGPSFIKTVAYAPFSVWVYLNGNEWAKQQAAKRGIEFKALDNGFAACEDPAALADDLPSALGRGRAGVLRALAGAAAVAVHGRRTVAAATAMSSRSGSLRSPTRACSTGPPPVAPGLSTRCPTSSRSGARTRSRSCSAATSRAEPRDASTPSVITAGVEAAIQVHYRASKVKQYFKHGRALRTETTVNDTHDFGVGRRLTPDNWDALVQIGHDINQRLLDHQLDACQCAPDATTLERVVLPSTHDGLPAPGLRFGEPRTMALLACLCCYQHLFAGLTNRSLRELIAALIPGYNARQMTYDLRRLRRKGFIQRIPRSQRYVLTSEGRRLAVFFTKTYTRIVNPALAELDPTLPTDIAQRAPLATAWRTFERALEDKIKHAAITA